MDPTLTAVSCIRLLLAGYRRRLLPPGDRARAGLAAVPAGHFRPDQAVDHLPDGGVLSLKRVGVHLDVS